MDDKRCDNTEKATNEVIAVIKKYDLSAASVESVFRAVRYIFSTEAKLSSVNLRGGGECSLPITLRFRILSSLKKLISAK